MIKELQRMMPELYEWLKEDMENQDFSRWDSLIVNRRKPHTYRLFTMWEGYRVCLHRFEPCKPEDAFEHPHPWPAAFFVVNGRYTQRVGYSVDLVSHPYSVMEMIATKGFTYEIATPHAWHSIRPLETTHTIMLNGAPWGDKAHEMAPTTKGKDLDRMSTEETRFHLRYFCSAIREFIH